MLSSLNYNPFLSKVSEKEVLSCMLCNLVLIMTVAMTMTTTITMIMTMTMSMIIVNDDTVIIHVTSK